MRNRIKEVERIQQRLDQLMHFDNCMKEANEKRTRKASKQINYKGITKTFLAIVLFGLIAYYLIIL